MHLEKIKEMFSEMVIKKNASVIPLYYHNDFLLYTNQETMSYAAFLEAHEKIFASEIQYEIQYDEETLLENDDKIAGRVWITTSRPNEAAKKIEVILIAQFKEGKIYRVWELTFPDWSKLPAFVENT